MTGFQKLKKHMDPPKLGPRHILVPPPSGCATWIFLAQEDVAEEGLEEGEHFGCSGVVGIVMDHGG